MTNEAVPAGGRPLPGLPRRPAALVPAALIVTLGVAAAMAVVAGPTAVRHALAHPHPEWLVVLVVAQAVAYGGYALAHRAAASMRDGPRLSRRESLAVVAVGFGPQALSGGFAVDRVALIGLGATPRAATVRVLALGSLEYAVLAPAAAVASLVLLLGPAHVHDADALTLPWAIGVPVGFAVGLWAAAPARTERLCAAPGRVRQALGRALEGIGLLRVLIGHPIEHREAWLGISLYWAADILALWAGLRLFGVHPGGAALLLAYATGYALSPRSMPLAGVGVTEALMPLALSWVGLSLAGAVVGVTTYRIAGLLVSIPAASLAWPQVARLSAGVQRQRGQRRREE